LYVCCGGCYRGKGHYMANDLDWDGFDPIWRWIQPRVPPELTLDPEVDIAMRV
jgi:hypothetical protein